ncbi:MAG: hypothetical protein EOP53_01070 [Sphingobacteriales bacterium]|nr:MAG: hypothetical protein EOP53_01070 [Sphingobacteriales bacterium]
MVFKTNLLLAVLFMLLSTQGFSQGSIISVMPSTGYVGQQQDVIIQCLGTNFKQNETQVSFGDEIQVQKITINTAENLVVKINIPENINPGNYTISIISNGKLLEKQAAYTVLQAGGKISAQLNVTPVQTLHLSDFDPNTINSAPQLFTVTVYNDLQERDLKAVLTVSGELNGKLGTATKILSKTQPGAAISFNNKQFDSYDLKSASQSLIQDASKTGLLPADIYSYHLELFAGRTKVAEAEGKNIINNTQQRPELIIPGVPFGDQSANAIPARQPLFQWFAQAKSYDFAIYKVLSNQNTEEEVVLNRPIFVQKDISGTTFLYPASAEQLIPNQLYAWQVKGNYNGSYGKEQLASHVFWFKVKTNTQPDATVKEIKIVQDDMNMPFGAANKFTVKAYNANDQEIQLKPTWRVIPANGGTITNDGIFTAGTNPVTVAILANYDDLQDYITVSIVSAPLESVLMNGFLHRVFGIPAQ